MNYCELSEFCEKELNLNDTYNTGLYIYSNNPMEILNDYDMLTKSLIDHKQKYEDLLANKSFLLNYINTSQNNHFNVVNIIKDYEISSNIDENDNNLSKLYLNYNNKIKDDYNNWYLNYYSPKSLSLQNNMDVIEEKITDYRNFFITIINKILKSTEINESKKLCPICFENEVDMCVNPCGHTLCNKCVISNINNYRSNKCYSCRTIIKDYIKIYFSV